MALFHRRDVPPDTVVTLLSPGERIVSWADTEAGSVVAATPRGLWWPAEGTHRLIEWPLIDKAVWRDGWLTVTEADVVDDLLLVDRVAVRAQLAVPRDLPPTVRKRIEANIVRTEVATIAGGAVRFVGRKRPGQDGVSWWARLEPGTRDTDYVRSAIAARLARLRAP